MDLEFKQIFTQILAFLVMLWILKRYLWKPLLSMLDERTQKIEGLFKDAERKNQEADASKAFYQEKLDHAKEEGQTIIQRAVKEADHVAQQIQTEAQQKAQEILHRAQEQSGRDLNKARMELKTEVVNVTMQAVEKLIRKKFSKEERDQLASELVDQVSFHD